LSNIRKNKRRQACDLALFIQLVVGFLDDDDEASLDVRLDLQHTSRSLVVVRAQRPVTSLDVRSDFQTARDCLVVLWASPSSLDVRFDFHLSFSIWMLTLNVEQRRHTPGFEAEGRRLPIKAGTGGRIHHRGEKFLGQRKSRACDPTSCSWHGRSGRVVGRFCAKSAKPLSHAAVMGTSPASVGAVAVGSVGA
jgi:hypothetical protein